MYAKKAVINYGSELLEVFQLPDGSYELSMTQVSDSIDKHDKSFRQFIDGNSLEALSYKDYNFGEVLTEGAGRPIKGVPIKIACAYWVYWCAKGNVKARALLAAGAEHVIVQLADKAFGIEHSADFYQSLLVQTVEQNKLMYQAINNLNNQYTQILNELALLRPAYDELQELNKSFEELRSLKPLLEQIAKVIYKPNQKTDTLRGWLKFLSLDNAVDNKKSKAIGRLIADWLKVGQMDCYVNNKPAKYPEDLVPLIKLATEYQLFHAK